jgi:hypothetical protein
MRKTKQLINPLNDQLVQQSGILQNNLIGINLSSRTLHLSKRYFIVFLAIFIIAFGYSIEANANNTFNYSDYQTIPYEEEQEPTHKQTLENYTNDFCKNRGKTRARIQSGKIVDCLTSEVLWKVEYADNWPLALVKSMAYPIYDDYRGEEEFAPKAGIALIQEDSDDYKNMIELKQLVEHYKLPVKLHVIENYGEIPVKESATGSLFKNLRLDLMGPRQTSPDNFVPRRAY